MMSTVSNAVSSLVMSLPLVAVPCLAIFGLPSIGPATAEADAEDSIELGLGGDLGPASAMPSEVPPPQAFAPIVDMKQSGEEPLAELDSIAGADRSHIAHTSEHRGASANQALGLDRDEAVDIEPRPKTNATEKKLVADAAAPTPEDNKTDANPFAVVTKENVPPSDWEGVLARLRQLGVQKFHITDGEVNGQFYFCCSIDYAPNVVRRYEAEGDSPTDAAMDVLAQVEQCQGTR